MNLMPYNPLNKVVECHHKNTNREQVVMNEELFLVCPIYFRSDFRFNHEVYLEGAPISFGSSQTLKAQHAIFFFLNGSNLSQNEN